jgi:YHS domain-containing protein
MKLFLTIAAVLLLVSFSKAQEKQKSCGNKTKCENVQNCKNAQNCEMKQKKAENTQNKKNENIAVVNKVCPISGEELENVNVTFTYKGKTYGLCCEKCLTKVKANPEKYLANLNDDGTMKKK